MYKTLKILYHSNPSAYNKLYKDRFNSEYSKHLDIEINNDKSFYVVTPEIQDKLYKIQLLDKNNWILSSDLPAIAIRQLKNKFIIDEVTITNDIEGVNSSRKEISDILRAHTQNTRNKKNLKFYDLTKKYEILWSKEHINFNTCKDLRILYDELVLQDVLRDNIKNKPDGMIFRKESVDVWNNGKKIHAGVMPEEKIISSIETALNHLNDKSVNCLLRAAAFHYLFGYVHPFYDGNGRLNRFISSYMFTDELYPLVSYRLSYTIKKNINDYYAAFKECNHPLNKGDITFFVDFFTNIILDSVQSLNALFEEKSLAFKNYSKKITQIPALSNKHLADLSFLLMQAELFSEDGISREELLVLTDTSTLTLRKRLNILAENNLLKESMLGKRKYYRLNLATVDNLTIKNTDM